MINVFFSFIKALSRFKHVFVNILNEFKNFIYIYVPIHSYINYLVPEAILELLT
jgi:hypothetical protein